MDGLSHSSGSSSVTYNVDNIYLIYKEGDLEDGTQRFAFCEYSIEYTGDKPSVLSGELISPEPGVTPGQIVGNEYQISLEFTYWGAQNNEYISIDIVFEI